ncbi:MAG: endo-1,4-beta-xylanase, partial [Butyrivibrio sp.]|nr:endo-1,4-beta-xylanase [Butyrivibrio sp.]
MHKKFLGLSALIMAGVLAVSSVNLSAMQVNAAGIEETETLSEPFSVDDESQEKEEKSEEKSEDEIKEDKADGTALEEKKELTEEVKEEVSEQEPDKKADIKDEADTNEQDADKGEDAAEPKDDSGDLGESGDTPIDTPIDDPIDDPVEDPASESSLVFFNRWNQSETLKGKLTFASQYQEYCYDLGKAIPSENLKSVTVKVKNQDKIIAFKLYSSEMEELVVSYTNEGQDEYTVDNTSKVSANIRYVGIMSMASGEGNYPYSVNITSIEANTTGKSEEVNEGTIVYEGEDLKFVEHWQRDEVDGTTLEYAKEWDEYGLVLKEEIPEDSLKSVTVTFTEATQGLGFKTYGEKNDKELDVTYGKSGSMSYTWYPSSNIEPVKEFTMMAMNNQDYPFEVNVEKIEFVVDTTPASERPQKGVEYDIVDLRDAVEALMGEDFIIGTAISYKEFADSMEMELVTKHFNGCTLGNELKPDSMLKSNKDIEKVELNGEEVDFPKLDFSTPEKYLDFFVDWNNKHPEKKIRIRGHVLVWHSQTPEFFFHEDYDENKPCVTPEVMNKRLEIYIRSVAEHFTAEGSKYRDLFYGWDVVNEAVSDGSGTYRTDSERSSWWKVYKSPEFIQNAFVYANRYMPSDIALFYNDYNETVSTKVEGICQLIKDVKATPGARIDGMGMQAHYGIANNNPSAELIKKAALRYAELVDQIQITELDFKGSSGPTDEQLAVRYKTVYDTLRRLKEEGVNVTGMTIWGVIDKDSWLQDQNDNGGGSDGSSRQYPLLFNDYYKAKNAFWTLVDAGELEPELKSVTLVQNLNNNYDAGNEYSFGKGDLSAKFVPLWSDGSLSLKVTVNDQDADDNDSFTVYTDDGNGIKAETVKRADATATGDGYEKVVTVKVDNNALIANKVKLDIVVTSNDKKIAFGDTKFNQAESSKFFAETVLKPLATISKG